MLVIMKLMIQKSVLYEGPMQRTWEEVEEDIHGELKSLQLNEEIIEKKRLDQMIYSEKVIEKGMIRSLFLIIDNSKAMDIKDIKPDRKKATMSMLEQFITLYFDQNPISQLGQIISYGSIAEKISNLSGNSLEQINILKKLLETTSIGRISLQNSLEIAIDSLEGAPPYGTKEILIVMGALSTNDPNDIFITIKKLKAQNITVNIISLSCELYIASKIVNTTNGTYTIVLSKDHFQQAIMSYIAPLPIEKWFRKVIIENGLKWVFLVIKYKNFHHYVIVIMNYIIVLIYVLNVNLNIVHYHMIVEYVV